MSFPSNTQIKTESQLSKSENTKIILNNIKQALDLNDDDNTGTSNLETSKFSNDSTLTDSSSSSKENNKMNEYLDSFDYFQFEQNFKKYYVDSSQNNNGNYDNYVKNALKLISLIPFRKLFLNKRVKEIAKKSILKILKTAIKIENY